MAGQQPIVSGVAGRYATALFELALEEKSLDAVKGDLDRFIKLMEESDDLARLVRSPVYGADDQTKALTAVLERAEISGLAAKFLKLVAANRRLFSIRQIHKTFRGFVARHKGEVTAQVTAAQKLNDQNLDALKGALKTVTSGKEIDFDVKVDPAIIGGLIVQVGSRMVDSSLRTKLNSIKLAMKEAR
jgi:F-type H+-transporting ATPase subunit delta